MQREDLAEEEEVSSRVSYADEDDNEEDTFMNAVLKQRGCMQLFILSFILAFSFGSILTMVPAIMTDRYARLNHGYKGDFCAHFDFDTKPEECRLGGDDAQNAASTCALVQNLITFFASPVVGSISDEKGRKGMLLAAAFLAVPQPLALVLMQTYHSINPLLYYAATSFSGLVNYMPVVFAALADITPPKYRAPSFGLTMASFYIALSTSPYVVTLASEKKVVSIASAFLAIFSCLFTLIFVPETLPKEMSNSVELQHRETRIQNEYGMNMTEKILLRPFRDLSILNRNKMSRIIAVMVILSGMVYSSDSTVLLYYIENRLDFNAVDVARYYLVHGLCGIFVQIYVLKAMTSYVGERYVVITAYSFGMLYNFLYGIASHKSTIYAAAIFSGLSSMGFPTVSSINSYNGTPLEQGLLQGALSSLGALSEAFGPMFMRLVYDKTKDGALFGAGTMFFLGTLFYFVGAFFAYLLPADQANSRAVKKARGLNQMVLLENDHLYDSDQQEGFSDPSGRELA